MNTTHLGMFGIALLLPPLLLLHAPYGEAAAVAFASFTSPPAKTAAASPARHHPDGPHATVPLMPAPPVRTPSVSRQTTLVQTGPAKAVTPTPGLGSLKPTLQGLLARYGGTAGLYAVDTRTGETLAINATQAFPAASTFKLPMATYILRLVDQGKVRLDEQLTLQEDDWEDGTGVLQETAAGSQFTVGRLLELAIRSSDNIATNMLLRRFGRPNVWAFEQSRGGHLTHDDENRNMTSPADLGLYMKSVLDGKVLSSASRQKLLDWMEHTDFDIRIAAGVPDDVPVAHKIGTLPGVVNDVGLVRLDKHPYLLAVCTQDLDEEDAGQLIAAVARAIYTVYAPAENTASVTATP